MKRGPSGENNCFITGTSKGKIRSWGGVGSGRVASGVWDGRGGSFFGPWMELSKRAAYAENFA